MKLNEAEIRNINPMLIRALDGLTGILVEAIEGFYFDKDNTANVKEAIYATRLADIKAMMRKLDTGDAYARFAQFIRRYDPTQAVMHDGGPRLQAKDIIYSTFFGGEWRKADRWSWHEQVSETDLLDRLQAQWPLPINHDPRFEVGQQVRVNRHYRRKDVNRNTIMTVKEIIEKQRGFAYDLLNPDGEDFTADQHELLPVNKRPECPYKPGDVIQFITPVERHGAHQGTIGQVLNTRWQDKQDRWMVKVWYQRENGDTANVEFPAYYLAKHTPAFKEGHTVIVRRFAPENVFPGTVTGYIIADGEILYQVRMEGGGEQRNSYRLDYYREAELEEGTKADDTGDEPDYEVGDKVVILRNGKTSRVVGTVTGSWYGTDEVWYYDVEAMLNSGTVRDTFGNDELKSVANMPRYQDEQKVIVVHGQHEGQTGTVRSTEWKSGQWMYSVKLDGVDTSGMYMNAAMLAPFEAPETE